MQKTIDNGLVRIGTISAWTSPSRTHNRDFHGKEGIPMDHTLQKDLA